ncbi:MAG TPA: cysteine rich repeat-containing protein [Anaeromyxobacter sp.]|nr:cysteine rich repeat-containing protein [Anaeromyxobacter sp.]
MEQTRSFRFILLMVVSAPLLAATAAAAAGPCVEDARRLCPDVPSGDGRIVACLRARWYDVSSACQQNVQRVEGLARQLDVACTADAWQYCQGVARGQGRVLSCLGARWSDLSTTCRDAVARASEKLRRFQTACAGDAAIRCADVAPGGGRVYACLKLQEDALSSACKQAMRP